MIRTLAFVAIAGIGVATLDAASAGQQWQGPDRTRTFKETGLLKQWPASGPAMVWTAGGLGAGFGSMAVAGERVFVQGMRGRNSVGMARKRAADQRVWWSTTGPGQPKGFRSGTGVRHVPSVGFPRRSRGCRTYASEPLLVEKCANDASNERRQGNGV